MKLTPELIAQAPSKLNPLKQRELDLRGLKLPAIENLGVTKVGNQILMSFQKGKEGKRREKKGEITAHLPALTEPSPSPILILPFLPGSK